MNVCDLFKLKGKIALITGGGRGIGQSISESLAEAGADIIIASRKIGNCREVAQRLNGLGVKTLAIRCDLGDENEIVNLVHKSMERFGRIDILVNNSGIGWVYPTLEYPIDKWDKVFNVNLRGPWILTQKVAQIMKEKGGGKIIFISSIWGMRGIGENIQASIAYNVSKGAINSLVKDLALKLSPYKINVNGIAPGLFVSDMTEQFNKDDKKEIKRVLINCIPLGRMGDYRDVKGLVLFLAGPSSDYMTGTVIPLDGGASVSYMPTRL
ncbi:MAG: glucose 1-dehydrogenase [Deltaproteobacteria bacterium]|nr:glucose 1-dehydrogenase [Deltaproteobacteria bacterium]